MFKRILVAVDGSAPSTQGLKSAIELAGDQQAVLHVLNVVDDMAITPAMDGGYVPADYVDTLVKSLRDSGRKILARAETLARERGVQVVPTLVETLGRSVAGTIVSQARKQKVDLIVLGTHGRRGFRRILLGSDAESVLRDSPVPVMLIRGHERAPRRTPTRTASDASVKPAAPKPRSRATSQRARVAS